MLRGRWRKRSWQKSLGLRNLRLREYTNLWKGLWKRLSLSLLQGLYLRSKHLRGRLTSRLSPNLPQSKLPCPRDNHFWRKP
ncbi:hypothetical protein RHMOL_Rhmol11G0011300 [Rhododendron molle]|uniref:Uncharacterized protein n=1 Tax=Rhododendron molle TaxID=49168 RepID=A0ACC0LND4_RHOML|nr:hypothetical protein RHMOL_Rhmol11G0011300 [Rhododendron molle]